MKTNFTVLPRLLFVSALFLAVGRPSFAATNVVILGDDFQQKTDAAAPGDTLVVQSGTYSGNLNFTKPLTVVRSGTNQLQLTGNATVSTTGTVTFSQVEFAGSLSTATNSTIVLHRVICSGQVTLSGGANCQAFDSQLLGLTATGGKVTVKRSSFSGNLSLNNTAVEALRMTNGGVVTATARVGSGTRFVAAQSSMQNGLNVSGYSAVVGYSSIIPTANFVDCDTVFVGNKVLNQFNACGLCVTATRGVFRAYNNLLVISGENNYCDRQFFGLVIDSANADIANNTIYVRIGWADNQGSGSYVVEAVGNAKISIRACILYLTGNVPAPFSNYAGVAGTSEQITELSYCDIYFATVWSPPLFVGGVSGLNCFSANPQFNGDYTLSAGSPCINAGPTDTIYSNRDGSRSDVGYTGGPFWNPANYTNDNPMVFWSLPTPRTVLKGLQSTIQVNVGASAGH